MVGEADSDRPHHRDVAAIGGGARAERAADRARDHADRGRDHGERGVLEASLLAHGRGIAANAAPRMQRGAPRRSARTGRGLGVLGAEEPDTGCTALAEQAVWPEQPPPSAGWLVEAPPIWPPDPASGLGTSLAVGTGMTRSPLHAALFLAIAAALAGCGNPELSDDGDLIGGKADGATMALQGTREGYAVLRLLNDGEGTTFAFLDDTVALDRRAAENLIAHRDGADGVFGTADDDLFDDIEEVDGVSWVGPAALEKLRSFAELNDYLPGDNEVLGTYDGIDFTYLQAEQVLDFVNTASDIQLRDANVPSRAVTSILDAQPIASIEELAGLYWVGRARSST